MKSVKLVSVAALYFCVFAYNSGWIDNTPEEKQTSQQPQSAQTYIIPLMKINGIQVRPEDLMDTP